MQAKRQESETVMFTCIKDLLYSNRVDQSEVRGTLDPCCNCFRRRYPRMMCLGNPR